MDEPNKLHVAMLSSPGTGHLIPALLLATRLATHDHHRLHITILTITTPNSPPPSQLLPPIPTNVKLIQIPPPDVSTLVNDKTNGATIVILIMREARATIRSAISSMNPPPDILITDLFGSEYWPIADEFGLPKYVYVPSNAWFVGLTMHVPVLDKEVKGQYVDLKEPLIIPGCRSVQPDDIIDPMQDRDDQIYREYVRMGIEYKLADGILMNTWEDLEHETLSALRNGEIMKVPVYPIGPLHRPVELENDNDSDRTIIEWLDKQPDDSVLLVSFGGGGGILSAEQIIELAWGLELSGQRFVWVLRPPADENANKSYLEGSSSSGTHDYLPDGFLERISEVGLIVESWAPQVKILKHRSVGGFLSHCGWNSVLESIDGGVPIIVWPLYAEQALNAAMLTEELKVAVRPEVPPTKKVVERDEIKKMVISLMASEKGKGMRERVKKLKKSAEEALLPGGSSYNSLGQLVEEWRPRVSLSTQ